ncbi:hypothetical protein PR202_ga03320 [Eleusine coracana subsp. coracana]|uniref:ABC transporter family G domain-containing protein n=1 Tax=Eleusine coracana subsp. coracana TaxID=191504 RepID=A0AAV5BM09_ELECO|nr:hypothetical protein PR202_ga03320 [Eleusine coracana subsp. coracana]
MKFYFNSLLDSGENGEKNYVRPNKNCNLSSWIDGCEPGWACSVGKDQKINLQDDKEIPYRALKCQQCCAGFFCPHGLTCMIPCPLGAYCPLSVLNKTTGICDPMLQEELLPTKFCYSGHYYIWRIACGVISWPKNMNVSSRPVIEIAFKDLTLTLKGEQEKLLRSGTKGLGRSLLMVANSTPFSLTASGFDHLQGVPPHSQRGRNSLLVHSLGWASLCREACEPPDTTDILEGIVKPSLSAGVTVKDLPLRWMLHNGYDVPRDMLQLSSDSESSFRGSTDRSSSISDDAGPSITSILMGNVKDILGQKKDEYDYNKTSEDLSNRKTPGILKQYRFFLGRCGKQRLREARIQGVDYLILCLAGICLGTLAKVSDETFGALGYTYTVIAVSLLCKIGALRSFSLDKINYWRERASGMSSLAYFLSKDTIDHFNTIVKPIVYLSMFYFFNNPRSSIWENYVVLVALVYCVTGIGYTFAIFFQPGSAQLWSALLPVVLTLVATQQKNTIFADLCYTKWALEAFVIANAQNYSGVWLITRCGSLVRSGYNIEHKALCIVVLIANGLISRCIAFFCMVTFQKH